MEDHIPTDELASEYTAAADYEDQALATLARLQCRIEDINNAQRGVDAGNSASTVHANVGNVNIGPRLPRLEIKPFNGNIRAWTAFWEQFEGTAHSNAILNETDKFHYLRNYLRGEAAAAVAGFATTSACYGMQFSYSETDMVINSK
ncbi:hypothetical protein HPB50_016470 [Hyalomma asiaticum]|uniref:Uncharacterized protein n=1 Tax=Hyalomma asiaticum TaxID=266040 RepID=A0ACB7SG90_HYAAI|nr:hypothetical protein HPB50_016470 [Hyalomma asiaticum]